MDDLDWLGKAISKRGVRPYMVYIPAGRLLAFHKHWQVRMRWNWTTFVTLRDIV